MYWRTWSNHSHVIIYSCEQHRIDSRSARSTNHVNNPSISASVLRVSSTTWRKCVRLTCPSLWIQNNSKLFPSHIQLVFCDDAWWHLVCRGYNLIWNEVKTHNDITNQLCFIFLLWWQLWSVIWMVRTSQLPVVCSHEPPTSVFGMARQVASLKGLLLEDKVYLLEGIHLSWNPSVVVLSWVSCFVYGFS